MIILSEYIAVVAELVPLLGRRDIERILHIEDRLLSRAGLAQA